MRVARGEIDVLNPGVSRIGGIEFARDPTSQMLVGPNVAKGLTAEGGLRADDFDARDPRVGLGHHDADDAEADHGASEPTRHYPLPIAALPADRITNAARSATASIVHAHR